MNQLDPRMERFFQDHVYGFPEDNQEFAAVFNDPATTVLAEQQVEHRVQEAQTRRAWGHAHAEAGVVLEKRGYTRPHPVTQEYVSALWVEAKNQMNQTERGE